MGLPALHVIGAVLGNYPRFVDCYGLSEINGFDDALVVVIAYQVDVQRSLPFSLARRFQRSLAAFAVHVPPVCARQCSQIQI